MKQAWFSALPITALCSPASCWRSRATCPHPEMSEEGEHAFVVVEVIDDGSGMSVDVMERAAGPFFTTKEVGNGSGWAKPGVSVSPLSQVVLCTCRAHPAMGTTEHPSSRG